MEKILIFIKHHFAFIWKVIELVNGQLFRFLYSSKLENIIPIVFNEVSIPPYSYRKLDLLDALDLYHLIKNQDEADLKYFRPHGFEFDDIKNQFNNKAFLMMGAFDGSKLVGYFFLRFFANKKSFVGRLIDKEYRGKGIGLGMNNIMYEIAWRIGFRCLSTISRNNTAVMHAHANNPTMIILSELQNNYLLVEFVRKSHIKPKDE